MSEYRTDPNESTSASPADEVSRVTADEVRTRMERGEPILFIDSRSENAWSSSDVKVPGAIRVPPDDATSHLSSVPKDRSIVVYCTWTHEASSARVARQLMRGGWKDVHALYGGLDAWQQAGGKVEKK